MYDYEKWQLEQEPEAQPPVKKGTWKKYLSAALVLALSMTVSGVTSYQVALSTVDKADTGLQAAVSGMTAVSYTGMTGVDGIPAVVEKAADSVVEISTEQKQVSRWATEYVTEGAGSGVILTEDGFIVTNHHVIDGAGTITVTTTDGAEYKAALLASDAQTDLAVLKIEATGLTYATLADSSQVRVGDLAIAIGNPLGELGGTVTEGIVSALDREVTIDGQVMTLMQTSAAVSPGNSGGGLFDANGNLIGIVNAKSSGSDVEGLAFAIPANTVAQVVAQLMEHGYVTGRPSLGISVTEVAGMRGYEAGVYITQVTRDNGLEYGDRIVSINGEAVSAAARVGQLVQNSQIGDVLEITVSRSGRQVTVSVTLVEAQPAGQTAGSAA